MMSRKLLALATLAGTLIPQVSLAYISPEDVLLNRELFLPPTSREAQSRAELQASESAERRLREQEANFDAQHPAAPEEPVMEDYTTDTSTLDTTDLSASDLELIRTLRLLNRVNTQQEIIRVGGTQVLHSGAPPLTPTGAGSALVALVMLGAVGYTLYRSKRGETVIEAA